MSDWHPRVIKLGEIQKHPTADNLSITNVDGNPVIFNHVINPYKTGDLVAYIPIDTLVPEEKDWNYPGQWDSLKGHRRIRAVKLRGIFSMGLLVPEPNHPSNYIKYGFLEGTLVTKLFNLTKYEPDTSNIRVQLDPDFITWNAKPLYKKVFTAKLYKRLFYNGIDYFNKLLLKYSDPVNFPEYTDIESLRKHKSKIQLGEEVILLEKIHGQNSRFGRQGKRFFVGSHYTFKAKHWRKKKCDNNWWNVAKVYKLDEILPSGYGFYAEIYGKVQKNFNYDTESGNLKVRFFDIWDFKNSCYLDYDDFVDMCNRYNLPMVPILYRGPWLGLDEMEHYSNGTSILDPNTQREGYVVRIPKERYEHGRVVYKLVGSEYLLNKNS